MNDDQIQTLRVRAMVAYRRMQTYSNGTRSHGIARSQLTRVVHKIGIDPLIGYVPMDVIQGLHHE